MNAIVHKDSSSCNPIQISVYEDKVYIWNDGKMPPNLDSTDKLFMKYSSTPYNTKLVSVFYEIKGMYTKVVDVQREKAMKIVFLYNYFKK